MSFPPETFTGPVVLSAMNLIFLEFMSKLTFAAVSSILYSSISASPILPDSKAKSSAKCGSLTLLAKCLLLAFFRVNL